MLFLLTQISACETLEQTLKKSEQASAILESDTAKSIIDTVTSDDPKQSTKEAIQQRRKDYAENPELLVRDLKRLKQDFARLMALLEGKVNEQWGEEETKLPSRKEYVKYTQNYKSRAIVDFDHGVITVETMTQEDIETNLRNAIITTLLTPDDPRAVDLFSDTEIELNNERPPYLLNLVLDHKQQAIETPAKASAFADYLLDARLQQRQVQLATESKASHYVLIEMVSNLSHKQAEKYRPLVQRYAQRYQISPSLVYAMIQTESNFNPFAVSPAPAYGLMQLVPSSGGRDAYRHAKGKDGVPSKEYLFDAENNIELGTAYLDVLDDNYLAKIKHAVSREYCVISAYNTGAGNVFRTFSNSNGEAIDIINSLQPGEVYERLRTQLPYEETRRYLHKVVSQRRQFVSL